jgi:hypothetical protein|tara:strand:+ start:316 stop:489 length:174 start_codon:yes stop_codon:yes gene_type:complete
VKLGTLVQFKAYNIVLDMGIISKYDDDPGFVWVQCAKQGSQRVNVDNTMMEVVSEAR